MRARSPEEALGAHERALADDLARQADAAGCGLWFIQRGVQSFWKLHACIVGADGTIREERLVMTVHPDNPAERRAFLTKSLWLRAIYSREVPPPEGDPH